MSHSTHVGFSGPPIASGRSGEKLARPAGEGPRQSLALRVGNPINAVRNPFTEAEIHRDYVILRMSQAEIASKYGVSQKVVWRAMARMGIKSRVASKRDQRGSLNSSWKGGRVLSAKAKRQRGERASFGNGYFYVLDHGHPNANKAGYVAEHIVVATKERGRALDIGEMVHHIDLNKHNNDPANLVITTAKQHAAWHNSLEEVAVSFMREGGVSFDPDIGYFRVGLP